MKSVQVHFASPLNLLKEGKHLETDSRLKEPPANALLMFWRQLLPGIRVGDRWVLHGMPLLNPRGALQSRGMLGGLWN